MRSQLSVGTKLTLVAGGLATVTLTVGLVALHSLASLNSKTQEIVLDPLPGMARISKVEAALHEWRGNAWRQLATTDQADIAAMERQMAQLKSEAETALKEYATTITTDEDRKLFAKIGPLLAEYYAGMNRAVELSHSIKQPEALAQASSTTSRFSELREVLRATSELNRRNGERMAAEASATYQSTWWILVLTAMVGLTVGGVSAALVIQGLTKSLRRAVKGLTSGSAEVASASGQLASSSNSLAQASSEQAASIEEVSASSITISARAAENQTHAHSAAMLVSSSQKSFEETDQALDLMVAAMVEINAQSGRIAKIIKVIDEIAFQTNILALNAAVEAARAGESGMGFAVVADEVRSLSHRCAQAARDTSDLIAESITKANAGKDRVDVVARNMRSITGEVSQIQALVVQVQSGSEAQGQGIRQVTASISQMQQVTQTTAASAEESSAAAQELSAQSVHLHGIVSDLASLVGR
ncbi:MAG: methyl-accepting chemotaxis protein [Acidobacteria bacterium]|nr:methyl-accepting chemotaxis protein [Acidobacteriota bacterium]